ncbi:cytochrome c biogenesis protein [Bacillaceae bacterium Marseille-Q3522]|nr:cytochrome c biogenesis protein [Bacillaceae bacterium Marseille-Q3522]
MKEVKCECGHINPPGTVICESCGKVLTESKGDLGGASSAEPLLDMRYEGSARRSQVYKKSIVDKIWNFFSSVKVGVILIVITLIASSIGTIFPQEMYIPPNIPAGQFYEEQYGLPGEIYYMLGLHHLYGSWWYLLLIASIGVSLVICSLDRVIPLYRSLKAQRVTRHESFLKRQRLFGVTQGDCTDESYQSLIVKLKKKRYSVREENSNLLAEKGRFSRWGPYINHIGLIIFLFGNMLRFIPGMYVDEILWVRQGETKVIPGTEGRYYLQNEQFILEVYDENVDGEVFSDALNRAGTVAKNYQTNVTLYNKTSQSLPGETPELEKITNAEIRVNNPLKFDHFALYQVDYKLNEFKSMTFSLTKKATNEQFGTITIDLFDPQSTYELSDGYSVELMSYFPDFEFDEKGEPVTKSRIPNNPAFVFKMYSPEKPDGEVSFAAIQQTIEPEGDNQYKMSFNGVETNHVSALTVRKDLTLWVLAVGGIIFMIGVIQGAYWNHRRIWIHKAGDEIWIAGHTNKNWHGLKKEIQFILQDTGINEPLDQMQKEAKG